jgi:hypothetical protein
VAPASESVGSPTPGRRNRHTEHVRNDSLIDSIVIAVVTTAVMCAVVPLAFLLSYFMNDDPGLADHARFLRIVVVVDLLMCIPLALAHHRRTRVPVMRSSPGVVLASFAPILAAGAVYAGLTLLPALDGAIGSDASTTTCLLLSGTLGVAAVIAAVAGNRLMAPALLRGPVRDRDLRSNPS